MQVVSIADLEICLQRVCGADNTNSVHAIVSLAKSKAFEASPPDPPIIDPASAHILARMTPMDRLILSYLIEGKPNREIAIAVNMTEQVVKNYLGRLYDKCGHDDRLNLVLFVLHRPLLRDAVLATRAETSLPPLQIPEADSCQSPPISH